MNLIKIILILFFLTAQTASSFMQECSQYSSFDNNFKNTLELNSLKSNQKGYLLSKSLNLIKDTVSKSTMNQSMECCSFQFYAPENTETIAINLTYKQSKSFSHLISRILSPEPRPPDSLIFS